MAKADEQPVCIVIPVACEAGMKKVAAAFSARKAKMMPVPDAERMTGFQVGGISPFGQKKKVPVLLAQEAEGQATIFVNGGGRGLQVEVRPEDLLRALDARLADVTA
ncbi:hypothetical protein LOC54_10120 [Acetobacter sp. AN02]|nr:hypothetical protein [Acetobacter sp. AN02]